MHSLNHFRVLDNVPADQKEGCLLIGLIQVIIQRRASWSRTVVETLHDSIRS